MRAGAFLRSIAAIHNMASDRTRPTCIFHPAGETLKVLKKSGAYSAAGFDLDSFHPIAMLDSAGQPPVL